MLCIRTFLATGLKGYYWQLVRTVGKAVPRSVPARVWPTPSSSLFSVLSPYAFSFLFPSLGVQLEECLLWLSIIFVTLRCLPPQVVRRWSDTAPVSADFLLQWRGFCTILTNAYYTQGMAW